MAAALQGRKYRRRKKEDVFIDGYNVANATTNDGSVDQTEEQIYRFGNDSPELDVQQNFGRLQLTILDEYGFNLVSDVLHGYNPDTTTPRGYNVNNIGSAHVFVNVKNRTNTAYVKSFILPGWTPGMPLPTGAPNDRASMAYTGSAQLPRAFEGAWITTEKVASGANLGATPVQCPDTGFYAVALRAIDTDPATGQEDVEVSASMVSSAGVINWPEIESAVTEITNVTHAMVYYLQTGTGVYPTVMPGKLWA